MEYLMKLLLCVALLVPALDAFAGPSQASVAAPVSLSLGDARAALFARYQVDPGARASMTLGGQAMGLRVRMSSFCNTGLTATTGHHAQPIRVTPEGAFAIFLGVAAVGVVTAVFVELATWDLY